MLLESTSVTIAAQTLEPILSTSV